MLTFLSQRTTSRRKLPSHANVRSTFQRRAYLLKDLPSCFGSLFRFLLWGQINSIFRLLRLFRSGSESAALSYINRLILLFPYVTSRSGSISFTSAGEAEVMVLPRGTPSPSTTTIHFEPLPRLVLPTSGPLFLQKQNFRQKILLPSSVTTVCPAVLKIFSKLLPRSHFLPNTAIYASRYWGMDSTRVGLSSGPLSVRPIKYPQNKLDYLLAWDHLSLVSAVASKVQYVSIDHQLTRKRIGSRLHPGCQKNTRITDFKL